VDIDGTLLNSQFQVSDANVRALREAHENHVCVVLATGRRHMFALPVARLLGFEPYIISSNGAVVRDGRGDLLQQTCTDRAIVRELLDQMQPYNDDCVITFDREGRGSLVLQSTARVMGTISRWVESNKECIAEINPLQDALTEDPIQMMYCGSLTQMNAIAQRLAKCPAAQKVTWTETRYAARDLSIIDILPFGCTKGRALEQLAARLNVGRESVVAIGDNYNDREMLAFAGQAFVVENAHDDLKSEGWLVTRSNDEDGVAHAIEQALAVNAR